MALVVAGPAVPVLGVVLLFGTGAAAAMRCRAIEFPKYGRIEQSKSDSFSGRRRPKPISTKFSDDHGKNLLREIRFLDLRTGADKDETNSSSNGNESK